MRVAGDSRINLLLECCCQHLTSHLADARKPGWGVGGYAAWNFMNLDFGLVEAWAPPHVKDSGA